MGRRRDNALLSVYAVIVAVLELAWLALLAWLVIRGLRAIFPEVPR